MARTTDPDADLLAALRRAGVGDVDDSGLARALYSSDGSLYRVLPRAVVRPRHPDQIEATLAVCRELGVPFTARGAGTSIAGNAVGPVVVVDTSRYLSRVHAVDPESRTASVDPGVVQAALQILGSPDEASVLSERHVCIDTTAAGGNATLLAGTAAGSGI